MAERQRQEQATTELSEAGRLRQVLDTARDGLRFAQWFQAIGELPKVVAACEEVFSAIPGFANEIARLSGLLDALDLQLKAKQAEATDIYGKLEARNRVAAERAEKAELEAREAEDQAQVAIAQSSTSADEAIRRDEERVTARKRALEGEYKRLETEHEGRKQLLLQRERAAREQAELAEQRLRDLAASIPVPSAG